MQLTIDSFDHRGAVDYTFYLDAERLPKIERRLNMPSILHATLVSAGTGLVVPSARARVWLKKTDGTLLFGGYLAQQPVCSYAGETTTGAVQRYELVCCSDEWMLDHKALPQRIPFRARTAGAILKQITADIAADFDCSDVADCDVVAVFAVNAQEKWSAQAAELALRARAVYRAEGGSISFAPVGASGLTIDERRCDRKALLVQGAPCPLNDVTVVGAVEQRTYVKDYFEGDGFTLSFPLGATPVGTFDHTVFEDEFPGTKLNPILWQNGSSSSAKVNDGRLVANGNALVQLVEQVEMGGGIVLQHGSVEFQAVSSGIVGGLYAGGLSSANCVAGVQVQPSGGQSMLQAIVNGAATGPSVLVVPGHQYQFTTRIFATQLHRANEVFHSSVHPSGTGRGGETIAADARVVIEVHDIDPSNPATLAADAAVLFDGVLTDIPAWCTYALLNGANLHCDVAFTRMRTNGGVVVRSAIPGKPFRTRLQGALADGAECRVTATDLYFQAADVPEASEQIVVSYRTM